MESVDVFPATPFRFQVLKAPTSADVQLYRPFECYIPADTNRMRYRMLTMSREIEVHIKYLLRKVGSGRPTWPPASWRKVDLRMRRVSRKTKRQDVTLCFRHGDTFVTKNLFTFGLRTARGAGDVHLFQTLVDSTVVVYMPKSRVWLPTSRERTFLCSSEYSYGACVLRPDRIYRVEDTTYVLVTQDKSVFSVHRCTSTEADAIEGTGVLPFVDPRSELCGLRGSDEEDASGDPAGSPADVPWPTEDTLPDSVASCAPMDRTVRWPTEDAVPGPPTTKLPFFDHVFRPPLPLSSPRPPPPVDPGKVSPPHTPPPLPTSPPPQPRTVFRTLPSLFSVDFYPSPSSLHPVDSDPAGETTASPPMVLCAHPPHVVLCTQPPFFPDGYSDPRHPFYQVCSDAHQVHSDPRQSHHFEPRRRSPSPSPRVSCTQPSSSSPDDDVGYHPEPRRRSPSPSPRVSCIQPSSSSPDDDVGSHPEPRRRSPSPSAVPAFVSPASGLFLPQAYADPRRSLWSSPAFVSPGRASAVDIRLFLAELGMLIPDEAFSPWGDAG